MCPSDFELSRVCFQPDYLELAALGQLEGKPTSIAVEDKAIAFGDAAIPQNSLGGAAIWVGVFVLGIRIGNDLGFDFRRRGDCFTPETMNRAIVGADKKLTVGNSQTIRYAVNRSGKYLLL